MSDQAMTAAATADDEKQVLDEITGLIAREREVLKTQGSAFQPVSQGARFPLLLNGATVIVLAAVALGLWLFFAAAQSSYVLKAAEGGVKGEDIVSALLAEAKNALDSKNKEIQAIDDELASIETKLSKLGLDDVVQRKTLTDRRAALQTNLAKALQERDALNRQVKVQTQNLEQAKSSAPAKADALLQDLMKKQELKQIYDLNLRNSLKALGEQVAARRWDGALAEIKRAQTLTADFAAAAADGDRPAALAQGQALTQLDALTRAVRDGLPQVAAVDPGPSVDDLNRLQAIIQTQTARIASLETLSKESTVQLDTVVKSLNSALGSPATGASAPLSVESMPIRIKELQQVAAKVQDFQVLVQKQATELESLKSSGKTGSSQLTAVLGSFDQLLAGVDPASRTPSTVENLPARLQELQKSLLKSQDSQVAALTDRLQKMQQERDAYLQLGQDYQARVAEIGKNNLSGDRQVLRKNLQTLLALFKDNSTGAQLFPDYPVYMQTMIENLITVETDRVKAMAQDELLAFMTSTQGKLADEQVKLLARSGNAKTDSTSLLTSLIKEIDQVTNTTLRERSGKAVPKALGSVIQVVKPTVTVRKVSRLDTFKVKRVFLSRILSNGDRIPIAEAEIVATTGEDIILKITSTIAPTIYPERNDLVFVEM